MAAISRAPAGRAQGHGLVPRRSSTRGDLPVLGTELGSAGRGRGRFLKALDGRCPGAGSGPAAPGSASHTRLSSVLSKVAQLESKIRGQKKQLEKQNSGLEALPEEGTSPGHGGGARGKRCWRNPGPTSGSRRKSCSEEEENIQSPKRNVAVKQQLELDSDEEEMRELMGSSLGFSSGNGSQKVLSQAPVPSGRAPGKEVAPAELSEGSSFHDQTSEESVFGRVNSPSAISRDLAGHTMRSPESSCMKNNTAKVAVPRAGCPKHRQGSLGSDTSEIKSLDELFSEGADAEDPNSSSSLEDFRLNILSLDDLASDPPSEAAESQQRGKDIQEPTKSVKKDALLVEEEQMSRAVTGLSEEDVGKSISEEEIPECLSADSSDSPSHKQDCVDQKERTPNSEYSEDSEGSVCAEGDAQSSPGAAPGEQRVEPRPCSQARANPSAAGSRHREPEPPATHLLSLDALQALSSHSPGGLALHSLCRQHLQLTQHFIHNVQHLHRALLESLDTEEFHYHSLQEAKEYIKKHKSPPLTFEQALEEVQRSQEK